MFLPRLRRRQVRSRVLSGTSAAVDRTLLPLMQQIWLFDGDPLAAFAPDRIDALLAAYAPDPERTFFPEPEPAPVEVVGRQRRGGGIRERWRWPSAYAPYHQAYTPEWEAFEENGTAWAEVWRHGDRGRPTMLCVHSWATGYFRFTRLAFAAGTLYRAGFDVVVPILPFHGPRTPRQAWFGGQLFPGIDPRRTNEAFGQSIWDLRALVARLDAEGAGPISAMGMSLGGYTTAVLASVEPRLHGAVPMIPLVSLADLLWHHGEDGARRDEAERQGISLELLRRVYALHSPLERQPLVGPAQRLLVAGRGDRVTPPGHVEALWEHWDRPPVHWFPGGHMSHFGRGRAFQRVVEHLAQAPALR